MLADMYSKSGGKRFTYGPRSEKRLFVTSEPSAAAPEARKSS